MLSATTTRTCQLCERPSTRIDTFGVCPSCGIAVDRQVSASWPHIAHDCDLMGAFHRWTRQHDDAVAK